MDDFVKLLIAFVVIRFIYKLLTSRAKPKAGGESSTTPPLKEKKKGWLQDVIEQFKEELEEQFESEPTPPPRQKPHRQPARPDYKETAKVRDPVFTDRKTKSYNIHDLQKEETTSGLDSIMENYSAEQKMIIFQTLMEKPSESNREY